MLGHSRQRDGLRPISTVHRDGLGALSRPSLFLGSDDAGIYVGGEMRIVQEVVSRRVVIEKYAIYDFQKKRGSQPLPNFDAWNWSSADAIDEELCRAGLKTGIPRDTN